MDQAGAEGFNELNLYGKWRCGGDQWIEPLQCMGGIGRFCIDMVYLSFLYSFTEKGAFSRWFKK